MLTVIIDYDSGNLHSASKAFERMAQETENHYAIIESEYAHMMGMVHETDIDTYVRE